MKTGIANLPLHYGSAPRWLFGRMVDLGREITIYIIKKYGTHQFLRRLSHPVWFQSLGCVMGFDWHSSGLTTTTCGALKMAVKGLEDDLGLYICGGKGATSRKTPNEINKKAKNNAKALVRVSKLSAKVDNTALQDDYQLYHHNLFFDSKGNWAVIQQGMNPNNHFARRYHWLSDQLSDMVNEPHQAVCCDQKIKPLNLVHSQSRTARKSIVDISRKKPEKILKDWAKITVLDLPSRHYINTTDLHPRYLEKVVLSSYENQKDKFSDFLLTPGLGPKTLRALTLLSEVINGAQPAYEDPVRYAFAHGGKDGIPYPVNKQIYDESISVLRQAVSQAKLPITEKDKAHLRLSNLARNVKI